MTVRELKEKLNEFNDNLIVMIPNMDWALTGNGAIPATSISRGINEHDGCVFIDDYMEDVDDVAQDVFIEPIQFTMTKEKVNEVIDRCRRRVVEASGTSVV